MLLREGVYPDEYMESSEKIDETDFYSNLNLENISDEDYVHAQKIWDVFEINDLGEYHDLYVQSDTLLLAYVYESFRNMCLEKYQLDPIYFVSAPGLAWQASLKTTGVKLELLTDIDMLLMVEKVTRGGICQATHRYAKANNKYMKNFNKNIESSYIQYLYANNLYGWVTSQKLPVNNFKWIKQEELSKFNEDFIKNYDENSNRGYFLEVDLVIRKNYSIFIKIFHFCLKVKK